MDGIIKRGAAGTLLLFVLIAAPLVFPVLESLFHSGSLRNIPAGIPLATLLGKSILIALSVAVTATLAGTSIALALHKYGIAYSSVYEKLLLIPLFVPSYLYAVAWNDIPLFEKAGSPAVKLIVIHSLIYFPLAMLITRSGLKKIHRHIEESALLVTPVRRTVLRVLLPLLRPSILLSAVLIFIFSAGDFAAPSYLGVHTYTMEIFIRFSAYYDIRSAVFLSVVLLLVTAVIPVAGYWSMRHFRGSGLQGKGLSTLTYPLDTKMSTAIRLALAVLILTVILIPLSALVRETARGGSAAFFRSFELLSHSMLPSVLIAAAGAFVITATGMWAAFARDKYRNPYPAYLLMFTFALPPTVLGIYFNVYYNRPYLGFVYHSLLIVLLGFTGRFGYLGMHILSNGLRQIPVSLIDAAKINGIPPLKRFTRIYLPLLAPSIHTSFVLSYILVLYELGSTVLLYPPGMDYLPVAFFTLGANAPQNVLSGMALWLIIVGVVSAGIWLIAGKIFFKKLIYKR